MEIWSFWQMPKGPAHILNCNVGPREEINLLAMHNKAILSIGYTVRQEQEVAPTIVSSPHPFDWIHVMSEVKMKLRHKEQSSNWKYKLNGYGITKAIRWSRKGKRESKILRLLLQNVLHIYHSKIIWPMPVPPARRSHKQNPGAKWGGGRGGKSLDRWAAGWFQQGQEEEAAAADDDEHRDNLPTGDAACSCSDRLNGDSRAWRGVIILRSLTLIIIIIIQ